MMKEALMMINNLQKNILVLGSGNFGTCLAQHLALKENKVALWSRNSDVCNAINKFHKNPKYLRELNLSGNIFAYNNFKQIDFSELEAIILAIPTQSLREVLTKIKPHHQEHNLLICAAKGIEVNTAKLPSDIISDVFSKDVAHEMAVLSGPSFAVEIAQNQPTGVTAASKNYKNALKTQQLFHAPLFRVYTHHDPIGLEIAGAMKNVIAISAGACQGLGFQNNSLATLITRGLAEMTRIGVALGANPITFNGLGGVGDLFLTCTSEKSRNFRVGKLLGQGLQLDDILEKLGSVAEGVSTSRSAYLLGTKLSIPIPITTAVYQVLHESKKIEQAVEELMTRDAKREYDF